MDRSKQKNDLRVKGISFSKIPIEERKKILFKVFDLLLGEENQKNEPPNDYKNQQSNNK
jgi:hypothetical protein